MQVISVNFGVLIWGGPPLWCSQILSTFIFSYLPILKFSSVQCKWLNFEFWFPCWKRIPSFWSSQVNWPRQTDRKTNDFVTCFRHWFRRSDFVTKWGFGQDGSGDSKNIFRIALLSQLVLFTVSLFTVSWFVVSLSRSVVVDPILVPPSFVNCYLFFMFAYPENFMCLAWVVKKLEFWWPCLRGTPDFDIPKFCQILSFLHICQP